MEPYNTLEMHEENGQQIIDQPRGQSSAERSVKRSRAVIAILCVIIGALVFMLIRPRIWPGKPAARYGLLSELVGGDVELDKFYDAYKELKENYYFEHDDKKMMEGALSGLADSLGDVYTFYFTPDEFDQFSTSLSGQYVGIGVSVTMDSENVLTILRVFPESPAEEAGLKRGDKVMMVGEVDVSTGYTSTDIVSMIKGEAGTKVNLTISRPSTGEVFSRDVERREIKNFDVVGDVLEDGIGYVEISSFDATVDQQFRDIMDSMEKKGVKGVIIDLRDNGGGYLTQTVNMCDMLLPKDSLILTVKDAKGGETSYNSKSDPLYSDMQIVLLVNEYSASASEVFTGVLKDHGRATVVGVTTFGKGIIQSLLDFPDGSAMKYTTSSYFTPGGYEIHGNGITPDVEAEQDKEYENYSISTIPEGKDLQLNKALEVIRGKINGN